MILMNYNLLIKILAILHGFKTTSAVMYSAVPIQWERMIGYAL